MLDGVPSALDTTVLATLFRPMGKWAIERGKAVEKRRLASGLTRAELAESCGLTVPTIWRIEAGRTVPSDRVRLAIAHHLSTTPEKLWRLPTADEIAAEAEPGRSA